MIAGDTGSCLCKGPWSKLAVTSPNAWSSYMHCTLSWFVMKHLRPHLFACFSNFACVFVSTNAQRERERGKLICHISSSNACAKEQFFILNLLEKFILKVFANLKETYCRMQIQTPISPKWMEGDERLGRPNARGQLVSQMLAGGHNILGAIRHDFQQLAGCCRGPLLQVEKDRPIRIHVNPETSQSFEVLQKSF